MSRAVRRALDLPYPWLTGVPDRLRAQVWRVAPFGPGRLWVAHRSWLQSDFQAFSTSQARPTVCGGVMREDLS